MTAFYQNNDTPLVGQMTPSNKDRRFGGKPLLVAYYDVDYSFDGRVGEFVIDRPVQIARGKILAEHFEKCDPWRRNGHVGGMTPN